MASYNDIKAQQAGGVPQEPLTPAGMVQPKVEPKVEPQGPPPTTLEDVPKNPEMLAYQERRAKIRAQEAQAEAIAQQKMAMLQQANNMQREAQDIADTEALIAGGGLGVVPNNQVQGNFQESQGNIPAMDGTGLGRGLGQLEMANMQQGVNPNVGMPMPNAGMNPPQDVPMTPAQMQRV